MKKYLGEFGLRSLIKLIEDKKADKTALNSKADKVKPSVYGNIAALDSNGNLIDSGKSRDALDDEIFIAYAPRFGESTGGTSYATISNAIANEKKVLVRQDSYYAELIDGNITNMKPFKFASATPTFSVDASGVSTVTGGAVRWLQIDQNNEWTYGLTWLASEDSVKAKADLAVPSAAGNIATLDAAGNLADSGKSLDDLGGGIPVVTASSSDNGNTYTATVPGVTELTNGMFLVIIPNVANSYVNPTLNVNDLGSFSLARNLSTGNGGSDQVNANFLATDRPVLLQYNGRRWVAVGREKPVGDDLTGTVGVSNGGTGKTSWVKGVIFASDSTTLSSVSNGVIGKAVLMQDDPSLAPYWVPKSTLEGNPIVKTAGSGSAYTATVPGITGMATGMILTIVPHVANTKNGPSLNINNLGAVTIRYYDNSSSTYPADIPSGLLAANRSVLLQYNGNYWITLAFNRVKPSSIEGTFPVTKGGTGKTSWTTNGLIYPSGSTTLAQLSLPTAESILTQNASGAPYWTPIGNIGGIPIVSTSGSGSAYTATVPGVTELKSGMLLTIIPNADNTVSFPTLNINDLGSREIKRPNSLETDIWQGHTLRAGMLKSGSPVLLQFNGQFWMLADHPKTDANDIYGTVPVYSGGTGKASWESNRLIYPSNNAFAQVPLPTEESVLAQNASGTPYWIPKGSLSGTKVVTGSYVGTGTWGQSNPNEISPGFSPKLVIVGTSRFYPADRFWAIGGFIWFTGITESKSYASSSSNVVYFNLSEDGMTLKFWGEDNANQQNNTSGTTFYWVAIG